MKRTDYISWDTYFMGVARLSAMRSKDPQTQVGACIVNTKKRIVGIGYNGFPFGIEDDQFPWDKKESWLDSKYPYVVHAEPNAILNATEPLDNATLYVTLFPCNDCAKLIIQSGIKEVVYLEDKYHDRDIFVASRRMFEASGVSTRQLQPMELHITE
ncbi:deoxycytidylate deaminase [Candidatus Xianfuyuplasma coldseepsis]|uniref:dCMP deaminase family protein n=1 Tax=Candidatus Xianfuyuplasma coldseepsis TaxID=2782163 RepID=A0A7L7KST7_9MOLU|nr:dCMP deaminase family protein [Xianfuyuplasma coldseepsis]QMS85880.1 dCMP deaminase family protein [Xianfuyuplasma coldseepsis]